LLQKREELAIEEFHDGARHNFERQRIAGVGVNQPELLSFAGGNPLFGQQLLARLGIQPGQAQGTHGGMGAFQRHQVIRFLAAGQQQAALMLGFRDSAQHPREACIAGAHATAVIPFLQERLQVVIDQQDTSAAQAFHQQVLASFEAGRAIVQLLGSKDLEAAIQQRFATWDIAQGAPDHDLEVHGHPMHHLRRQRRLANATLAQHADHPTTLVNHPRSEQLQLPLAPIEAGDGERVAPIDAWPATGRRSQSVGSGTGLGCQGSLSVR
jgi:hypothetical protein